MQQTDMTREKFTTDTKINLILSAVKTELERATAKHGPMQNAHEAFGIIYEEFNIEFADEMHANNREGQRHEMIQVAAMACRFLLDCTDGT